MKESKQTTKNPKKTKQPKTHSMPLRRQVLLAVASVGIVLLAAFLLRGWLRMTAIPRAVDFSYGSSVDNVLQQEMARLNNPFMALGYTKLEREEDGCQTAYAEDIRTQVACVHVLAASRQLSTDEPTKADMISRAEGLQKLLQENGWKGEYKDDGTYTSLRKLVTSITSGIDYQPDATYHKRIGKVQCFISSYTAFSTPEPPTMATRMICMRNFNLLGSPSYQLVPR